MSLATAIKAIEDAIVQRLIDTAITGVNGIVFNRELRQGTLKNPYLRIFIDPMPINPNVGLVIGEEWEFKFVLMCVAASYESQDADQARDLALQAGSAMFWNPNVPEYDRTLGGAVEDIVRTVWHADFTRELPTEQLFGSAFELEARTILREV
jgi:hypothetical protein